MPTYSYICDACGHGFERFHSIKDPAIRKCPSCGKMKVRRLIGGGTALIFKGSGFYITDYVKKSGEPGKEKKPRVKKETNGSAGKSGDKSSGAKSADSN